MVRRFDTLKGDKTAAGGTVIGGDANDTVGGIARAYERDDVWCPACESMGLIVCDGPRLSMQGPDGREGALSDDLCVCECNPPPRLLPSQFTSYVDT